MKCNVIIRLFLFSGIMKFILHFRFGIIENNLKNYNIYTIANPVVRSKNPSYLQSWSPSDGALKKSVSFGESLSALAVSDDGRFVSVGTMFSGSVDIYISFSLQVITIC